MPIIKHIDAEQKITEGTSSIGQISQQQASAVVCITGYNPRHSRQNAETGEQILHVNPETGISVFSGETEVRLTDNSSNNIPRTKRRLSDLSGVYNSERYHKQLTSYYENLEDTPFSSIEKVQLTIDYRDSIKNLDFYVQSAIFRKTVRNIMSSYTIPATNEITGLSSTELLNISELKIAATNLLSSMECIGSKTASHYSDIYNIVSKVYIQCTEADKYTITPKKIIQGYSTRLQQYYDRPSSHKETTLHQLFYDCIKPESKLENQPSYTTLTRGDIISVIV